MLHGNGPGGLHAPSRLKVDLSPYDWVIGISDLQVTGHPDLIVRQKGSGRLYALPGTRTGLKAPVSTSAAGSPATTWRANGSRPV